MRCKNNIVFLISLRKIKEKNIQSNNCRKFKKRSSKIFNVFLRIAGSDTTNVSGSHKANYSYVQPAIKWNILLQQNSWYVPSANTTFFVLKLFNNVTKFSNILPNVLMFVPMLFQRWFQIPGCFQIKISSTILKSNLMLNSV